MARLIHLASGAYRRSAGEWVARCSHLFLSTLLPLLMSLPVLPLLSLLPLEFAVGVGVCVDTDRHLSVTL